MLTNIYDNINRLVFFFLLLFLISQPLIAQGSGSVKGTIVDKKTGETLVGTNVVIKNTGFGAATDIYGKFIIYNIPEGPYQLVISYIGYHPITVDVNIIANKTIEVEYQLEPVVLEGQDVIITAQAQGQLEAINQQLSSNTIANIVARDRIQELPDVNAAETIGRLPGVSIERSGGEANKVTIRGLEPKYNTITVNGVRLPATDSDNRSVDLSLISSNMLDGITLKKANTPDMDADALGGTIDLRLKEAQEGLQFSGSAQGGYNQLQDFYGNYNFKGSVSNRFLDNSLGVILNFNVDRYDRSADKFQGDYEQTGSGTNIIVKPHTINLRDESVERSRRGGSLFLDYRLPDGKITANTFYSIVNNEAFNRVNRMAVSENRHIFQLEDRDSSTSVFIGTLGAEEDFGWFKYDASISRTQSSTDTPNDLLWNFVQENSAFRTGDVYAGMDPHLIPGLQTIDTSLTGLRSAYSYSTLRKENETAFQLNLQMPFNLGAQVSGYIKFGGKFRWQDRDNDQEQWGRDNIQYGGVALNSVVDPMLRYLAERYPDDWNWESDSALAKSNAVFPISRFLSNEPSPHFLEGEYDLGFMINEKLMNQVTEALRETGKQAQNWLHYYMGSEGYDYNGIERYQAGYIMSEISWNFLTLIPGVRYEKDYSKYTGHRFREIDQGGIQGPPQEFTELTNERNNEFWLPMVHLIAAPADWLKIRLARTETLTRPDYVQYTPFTTMDRFGGYIRANNGELKPAKSANYDVSISVYENYVGFFTFSGFYKSIKDLIFQVGYQLRPTIPIIKGLNVPDSWRANSPWMDTYVNNPHPAEYKGFELDWQTRFWYLPSFLQGIVLNINYTRIFSEVDKQLYLVNVVREGVPPRTRFTFIDTIRTARMPFQPAQILNVTFGYDYMGFSARVSYLYQTDKTNYVANYEPLDNGTGTYARWDVTLQQKLDWGLQVFTNISNLNKRADRNYRSHSETNASYTEYYGLTIDFGLRYNL